MPIEILQVAPEGYRPKIADDVVLSLIALHSFYVCTRFVPDRLRRGPLWGWTASVSFPCNTNLMVQQAKKWEPAVQIPRSHELWRETAKERPERALANRGKSGAIGERLRQLGLWRPVAAGETVCTGNNGGGLGNPVPTFSNPPINYAHWCAASQSHAS